MEILQIFHKTRNLVQEIRIILSQTKKSGTASKKLDVGARLKSLAERNLVGVLDIATHTDSLREPSNLYAHRLDESGEVHRSCLAFDIGVGRHNNFLYAV